MRYFALIVVLVAGCHSESFVSIDLTPVRGRDALTAVPLDSLIVRVTSDDITPIEVTVPPTDTEVALPVPSGPNRLFELEGRRNVTVGETPVDLLVYQGEARQSILPGDNEVTVVYRELGAIRLAANVLGSDTLAAGARLVLIDEQDRLVSVTLEEVTSLRAGTYTIATSITSLNGLRAPSSTTLTVSVGEVLDASLSLFRDATQCIEGTPDDVRADGAGCPEAINEAPFIEPFIAPATVPENSIDSFVTLTALDPDAGDSLAWTVEGADSELFQVDVSTDTRNAAVRFRNGADFETPLDADTNGIYEIALTVTDSGGLSASTATLLLEVTNIDEPPVLSGPATVMRLEGAPLALSIGLVDPEGDEIRVALSGPDNELVRFVGKTTSSPAAERILEWVSPRDFEAPGDALRDNTYEIEIVAAAAGATERLNVQITVEDRPDGFRAPEAYETANAPRALVALDVNGDGVRDVITANRSSDNIAVLLGNGADGVGDGTFQDRVPYDAGNGPQDVVMSDVNGDGVRDIITANFMSDDITVLFANGTGGVGDGTFQAPVAYAAGQSPRDLVTSDVNGDDVLDVITANFVSDDITVLLGNGTGGVGDGTFQDPVAYAAGQSPRALVTSDVNGDGVLDVITANRNSDDITVLLGDGAGGVGDGTFQAPQAYEAGGSPLALVTSDVNGDGVLDVITANGASDDVTVLLGNGAGGVGDGTFQDPVAYAAGDDPVALVMSDVNGDGVLDVITTNGESDDVTALLGNGAGGVGDGTFQDPQAYEAGNSPEDLVMSDVNGDGVFDVITANELSNDVTVLLGNGAGAVGDGTFQDFADYAAGTSPLQDGVTSDVNGDGVLDVIAVDSSGLTRVLIGNGAGGVGNGTFRDPVNYSAGGIVPNALVTSDINGDGVLDVIIANANSHDVTVLIGNGADGVGDGTFDDSFPVPAYPVGEMGEIPGPVDLVMSDVNGDGVLDAITANQNTDTITVLLGNGAGEVGDGTFREFVNYDAGDRPSGLVTSDVNGDGVLDVITANFFSDDITVLLGNGAGGIGDGTFQAPESYRAGEDGEEPVALVTADVNGDGALDVITANSGSGNVAVLLGNVSDGVGDGTFRDPLTYASGAEPVSLVIFDVSGDGVLDVITANELSGDVTVLLGNGEGGVGDGTFQGPVAYDARDPDETGNSNAPQALVTSDVNGDAVLDVIVVNFSGRARVLLGNAQD